MLRDQIAYAASLVTLALVLASATGCSSPKEDVPEATAQASGSVAIDGKAVKSGTVGFFALSSGASGQAPVDKAGNFQLESPLAPGEYTVYLSGASNVPEKFTSETSSDYTVTLTEGDNDLKIDLK